jgi:murein DD-endopeptidase MepM/ murein hydrolase activator NlpD
MRVAHAGTEASTLAVTVTARELAPGEVVRLDVHTTQPVAKVQVKVFDRAIPGTAVGHNIWRALVGIDLDTEPGEYPVAIEARTSDEGLLVASHSLEVVGKEFPTRRLRVAPKYVRPPGRVLARINRESAALHELFGTITPERLWRGPFELPIPGAVVSGFGVRSVFNGEARAPHSGADLRGRTGTPVRAPNAGRVVLVGSLYFTGRTIVVDHGEGLLSLFAHLSRTSVRRGEMVRRGEVIGAVGATGRVTGPHLHWTVRLQEARVDPLSLIYASETPP